ncbi:MAG TPA: hypothetical protein VHZ24_08485 [Pirellulales bacterium]|jgi:hypothetical protein|nr:hypothetical protein [Pirellulales bacterium]
MTCLIRAVGRPEVAPLAMSDRFRHEISYFMSLPDGAGVPSLPPGEYWIHPDDVRRWLDEGVFFLVSPLDSENKTEIELSEEHELFLEWLQRFGVERVVVNSP